MCRCSAHGSECQRVNFYTERGDVLLLELARLVTLDECSL